MSAKSRPRRAPGSAWIKVPVPDEMIAKRETLPGGTQHMRVFQHTVWDGHLTAIVDLEPRPDGKLAWHVSVSHRTNTHPPKPGRYPNWDELTEARDLFMPADADVVMCLPPRRVWVNDHDTCFHLWQFDEASVLTGSRS